MMNAFRSILLAGSIPLLLASPDTACAQNPPSPRLSVFATGFDNPRGLKFGPDGNLYVAEGGRAGTMSSIGLCPQVPAPVGPYLGGFTAGISKVNRQGVRTKVIDGLPSSQTGPGVGSAVSGVADVAFIGHTLYALLAGAGCSHGFPGLPNGVIRVNGDGTWTMIADLSSFLMTHPVAHPESDDFEPDGTWYSMIAVEDHLYAVEPNHGELDRITVRGEISRVIDISARQGHVVPTSVAFHGNFYVGNLTTFPVVAGAAQIFEISPNGHLRPSMSGFTTVLGVAFDSRHRLYVLETSSVNGPGPIPGTGRVLRVEDSGEVEVVAKGLTFPTAMTFGPDGNLYISNFGFGFGPGEGQVVRVQLHKSEKRGDGSEVESDDE